MRWAKPRCGRLHAAACAGVVLVVGWLAGASLSGAEPAAPGKGGKPQPKPPENAASPALADASAEELVQEALHREIYGLNEERNRLLRTALAKSPDFAPAHWHSGEVRIDNAWVKVGDIPSTVPQNQRYQEYLRVRGNYTDSVADQFKLADWCEKRRLKEQARAHFNRVLQMAPDHAQARARLGFQRLGGNWHSAEEVGQMRAQAQKAQRDLAQWKPKLQRIRQDLSQKVATLRDAARARLLEVGQVEAIPAMELVFARSSEPDALLLVEVLGKMSGPEATLALARQAAFSEWEKVRDMAVKQLKGRPADAFVPAMLAAMVTPIRSQDGVMHEWNGLPVHRQVFLREGWGAREEAVVDTLYWNPFVATQEAWLDQQNDRAALVNQRIASALNAATDQRLPADPEAWWAWWDEYTEVTTTTKPVRWSYERRQAPDLTRSDQSRWDSLMTRVAVRSGQPVDYGPPVSTLPPGVYRVVGRPVNPPYVPMESYTAKARISMSRTLCCFAAGTPVWTLEGPRPIEALRVGDLVLSQHPRSGELSYKPVLHTLAGPEVPLLHVLVGSQWLRTSGGHPFWVSGEGWVRARQLNRDAGLHTVTGSAMVSAIEEREAEKTYNLVVADFSNYFIGQARILVHDVTAQEPVANSVPGLRQP